MSLDFRICAAMFYQVRRMAWISAGVGWSGRDGLNLAVIRMRQSLPVMSAVDSRALLVYQGGAGAVAAYAGRSCPAVAYQVMAMLWQASWKETVRRRARAVRLRACPVPRPAWQLLSRSRWSICLRTRSMTCAAVSVVTRPGRSRRRNDRGSAPPGRAANRRRNTTGKGCGVHGNGLAVAGDGDLGEHLAGRELGERGQPVPVAGRPRRPVFPGGRSCSAASLRSLVVQVKPGASWRSSFRRRPRRRPGGPPGRAARRPAPRLSGWPATAVRRTGALEHQLRDYRQRDRPLRCPTAIRRVSQRAGF